MIVDQGTPLERDGVELMSHNSILSELTCQKQGNSIVVEKFVHLITQHDTFLLLRKRILALTIGGSRPQAVLGPIVSKGDT
jgi:hypothetical protein